METTAPRQPFRGSPLVAPRGLDISNCGPMRRALAAAAERGPDVVVDLSYVEFVDATALGLLAAQHRELTARGGSLVLAAPRLRVRQVLRAAGLGWLLER